MFFKHWLKPSKSPRKSHDSRRDGPRLLSVEPLERRAVLTAGLVDTSFGGTGLVTANLGLPTAPEQAWDVAVYNGLNSGNATDGKIVAVGMTATRTGRGGFFDQDFALVRYNADGTPDTSFGGDGIVTTALSTGDDLAYSVELVAGNKILAFGLSGNDFALARYTDNGSLDPTFGTRSSGKVITDIGKSTYDVGYALAIQRFGTTEKYVAAGVTVNKSTGGNDLALVRYTATGSLDTTFGAGGKVVTSLSGSVGGRPEWFSAVVVPSSAGADANKVVVLCKVATGSAYSLVAVRYTANGQLDSTFGTGGRAVITGPGGIATPDSYASSVAVQADGKVVVGYTTDSTLSGYSSKIVVVRMNANGTRDASFGSDPTDVGTVTIDREMFDGVDSVAIQADGKIVIGGRQRIYSADTSEMDFLVARILTDGRLDPSFGTGGLGSTAIGSLGGFNTEVALQANGKVIIAGRLDTPGINGGHENDIAVARFTGDDALLAAEPGVQALGMAAPGNIGLDNTSNRGWLIDATPPDDSEFTLPGNQGKPHRMDRVTVVRHEGEHLLGHELDEEGEIAETLAAGIRRTGLEAEDTHLLDRVFAEACEQLVDGPLGQR